MPTIAELQQQRADISRQIDEASLAGINAALAILQREEVTTMLADLEQAMAGMATDGTPYQQVNNVVSVVRGVTGILSRESARIAPPIDPADQQNG
ncbi:MAG: hypothetical protein DI537_34665 [Stutzerimonas stutzeri]|nr:MAG: hypothetical protein DI537_34665 [Stutzerimonas stutzeri]